MIQAECSCGWTMAGPPADSWEIDQAIDEHDVWCPENDWVNDEIEGQQIERDRIIGKIRATFSPECADHIVDVIARNMTNGTGNPAKSSPDAAPNPNHLQEERAMINTTQPTPQRVVTEGEHGYYIVDTADHGAPHTDREHAQQIAAVLDEVLPSDDEQRSAWHPIWCIECEDLDPDERHHMGRKYTYSRGHSIYYGAFDFSARVQLWDWQQENTTPTVEIGLDGGADTLDLTLHDLDQVINVLSQARQQLIEVGED